MNQKLTLTGLALLFGVLPAVSQAQSAVTVYGLVDASVRNATNAGPGGRSIASVGDGAYTGSRLGFRGTEDLGGGMKALFVLENGFDPSAGVFQQVSASANNGQAAAPGGRIFGREAWVALQTGYGTLSLGRQYTIAHTLAGRFLPQANPNIDPLGLFATHHVARQDNMVRYAANFGGIGVHASLTANEGNGKGQGLGASYAASWGEVMGYYQEVNNATATVRRRITGLGGQFALIAGLKGYVGYMKRDDRGADQENKVYSLGLNYALTPSWTLTASYGEDHQTGRLTGTRRMAFGGASYAFSKRTDLYMVVDSNRVSGTYPLPSFMNTRASASASTVGLRHRF